MSTDNLDVTVAEMLRRIEAGRAGFDRVLKSARPGAGAWTAKDHMAHIACWERSALALLNGEPRQGHLGISNEEYAGLDTDAINDRIRAIYRDAHAMDVERFYRQAHADLVAKLQSMTDEDLLRPYSYFQPDDPPYNPNPVWPWIAGNTFGHYEEHAKILQSS